MIPALTFAGQNVAVFGLGRSGLATCRSLAAAGARPHPWDDNAAARKRSELAGFNPTDLRDTDWSKLSALVLAPGVPLTHPEPHWTVERARDAGVEVIGDVEIFARTRQETCPDSPFVAITGTNGKSTTTALISHVLAACQVDVQMGGNIGVPILELEPPATDRVHVIELSSYQIDLMPKLWPTIGILLNISADHIDRHGTLENYASIKSRVLAGATHTVVGIDDAHSAAYELQYRSPAAGEHIAISGGPLDSGVGGNDGTVKRYSNDGLISEAIADIQGVASLRGSHNIQNAAAAMATAALLGLPEADAAAALRSFPGLPHRMEQVGQRNGVLFVNDSKATNAASAATALAAFERDIFWIAGGLAKDGGIDSLSPYFPRIAKAYLIGEAAPDFAATLADKVPTVLSGTLHAAATSAIRDAEASGCTEPVILLSPASASFDQFASFEARGDAFREQVKALIDSPKETGGGV